MSANTIIAYTAVKNSTDPSAPMSPLNGSPNATANTKKTTTTCPRMMSSLSASDSIQRSSSHVT
ncbi:hypothetical protein ACFQFH_07805 [Halobaculum halobium]|uniref:Uncharacterized protein n=1 Tax=Halobaculum halobium TaxID=3032281 RepID=A0ABD5TE77_9EURY